MTLQLQARCYTKFHPLVFFHMQFIAVKLSVVSQERRKRMTATGRLKWSFLSIHGNSSGIPLMLDWHSTGTATVLEKQWYSTGKAVAFHWYISRNFRIFHWNTNGIRSGIPLEFGGIPQAFQGYSTGIDWNTRVTHWYIQWNYCIFHWNNSGKSVIFHWNISGITLAFQWYSNICHGNVPVEFQWHSTQWNSSIFFH